MMASSTLLPEPKIEVIICNPTLIVYLLQIINLKVVTLTMTF